VDASDDDIRIVIFDYPYGIIRPIDRHRFTMADIKDGSVTYELTGNRSDDNFRFKVRVGEVESTGRVVVRATNVTSATPTPNLLRVATNVVATVDELDSVPLSPHVLQVMLF